MDSRRRESPGTGLEAAPHDGPAAQGLAGIADVWLDASRVLGETKWYDQAKELAQTLQRLAIRSDDGSLTWLVEDRALPCADLMVGCGGIVHLFVRLCSREDPGAPLMLPTRAPR